MRRCDYCDGTGFQDRHVTPTLDQIKDDRTSGEGYLAFIGLAEIDWLIEQIDRQQGQWDYAAWADLEPPSRVF